ncbi:hypothetical protein D0C36_19250 [Mucilaginibacter conchicola]|uniref:Plasmid transfer protein n=1 Tax=Mucilaginibacter conchicola TaxID=2303333 RepID=A0A372NQ67_9SPHI|nr:hypothetical protein [Mucilaginibacter conchicola]RFZ91081.1 hypothetical protein D0C36_19250 [Mucilaginibacter conchicola]
MKKLLAFLFSAAFLLPVRAQEYVIDTRHAVAVSENGAARSLAELTHANYLQNISGNLNDLNTNTGSVVLAQTMIYNALSNVNSALKNGLELKNMALIIADMNSYIVQALALAKDDPALLLFAGNISSEMKTRAVALLSDVSGFVLKEGKNVLADYAARDELLRKVTQHLQILDGLAYGAWKAMYWAKQRGIIASLNPFSAFINRDRLYVEQIILQAKYLRR